MDKIVDKFFSGGINHLSKYNLNNTPEKSINVSHSLQEFNPNNRNNILNTGQSNLKYDTNQNSNNINPVSHQLHNHLYTGIKKKQERFDDLSSRLSGYGQYVMKTDNTRHVPDEFGPPIFDAEEFRNKKPSHEVPLRMNNVPTNMKLHMMEERFKNLNALHKRENDELINFITEGAIQQKLNQEYIQEYYNTIMENTMLYSQFYVNMYSGLKPPVVEEKKDKKKKRKNLKRDGKYYVNPDDSSDIEFDEFNPNLIRRKSSLVDELEGEKKNKNEIQKQLFEMEESNKKNLNILGKDISSFKTNVLGKMENIQRRQEDSLDVFKKLISHQIDPNTDIFNSLNKRDSISNKLDDKANNKDNKNYKEYKEDKDSNSIISDKKSDEMLIQDQDIEIISNNQIANLTKKLFVNKLAKFKEHTKKITKKKNLDRGPKKTLRSYVYSIILIHRLIKFRSVSINEIRLDTLKVFCKYYENLDEILNFENLKLDLLEEEWVKKAGETNNKYINLEGKLKTFMESLIENTTEYRIDKQLRSYLKFLIGNQSIIPIKFFVLFELTRIKTENSELQNMTVGQQKMILAFYILVKILIKKIFIDHKYSETSIKTKKIRKNFKMIASVFYREIINYFNKVNKVLRPIHEKEYFDDLNIQNIKPTYKYPKKEHEIDYHLVEQNYMEKLKKYETQSLKNRQQFYENVGFIENKDLKKINKKLQDYMPDKDLNEIDCIQASLYETSEMDLYFKNAKENKFSLIVLIINWINQLYKVLSTSK